MAAEFTREDVDAIAALANLEIQPSELELFARQLSDILAYADELRQVDTADVAPTVHGVFGHEADRPDRAEHSLDPAAAVANAPDAARDAEHGSFFKVPRILG